MHDLYTLNFILVLFFVSFIALLSSNDLVKMLFISELLWILLYSTCLLLTLLFNNVSILAVSLFFLMFSAAEVSVGLLLLVFRTSVLYKTDL